MINTGFVLVKFHPTNGASASCFKEENDAIIQAQEFANQHYPDVLTHSPRLLSSWILAQDDGKPFFWPKVWPIAIVYNVDAIKSQLDASYLYDWHLPEVLTYLAQNNGRFAEIGDNSLDAAKNRILSIIHPHGGWAENNGVGGITYKLKIHGRVLDVGYSIVLTS